MKKLLIFFVLFGVVHEAHAMSKSTYGKKSVGIRQLNYNQQLFIANTGRAIIELDAPDLKREFDCCLNKLEKDLTSYIKGISYEYDRSVSNVCQQKLQKLNASKNKVKEQFGQDIFLAPNDNLDVQYMRSNWNNLDNYMVQNKIHRRIFLAMLEKERQEREARLNLVKKNSEIYKNCLRKFSSGKLKGMLPDQIKQLIHQDKMSRE